MISVVHASNFRMNDNLFLFLVNFSSFSAFVQHASIRLAVDIFSWLINDVRKKSWRYLINCSRTEKKKLPINDVID